MTFQGDLVGEAESQPEAYTEIANNNNSDALRHGCRVTKTAFSLGTVDAEDSWWANTDALHAALRGTSSTFRQEAIRLDLQWSGRGGGGGGRKGRGGWRRRLATPKCSSWFSPRTGPAVFCGADHQRQGGGQGSTALRGAGLRSARRRCVTWVWWRRSPP